MPIRACLAFGSASVTFFLFLLALWFPQERWAFAPLSAGAASLLLFGTLRGLRSSRPLLAFDLSTPLDPWILLYAISFFVSMCAGTAPGIYAQEIQHLTAWISIYYTAVLVRRHPAVFRAVCFTIILAGTLIALLGLWKALGAHEGPWTRLNPFSMRWNYRSHVQFSGLLGMMTALGAGAALGTRHRGLKYAFAGCSVICAAVMVATQSRIGWAALPVSFAAGALLAKRKIRVKLLLAAGMVLPITAAIYVFWPSMQHRIVSMGGAWIAGDARFDVWRAALNMFKEHWLTGVGPGMGRFAIMSYRPEGFDRLPEHLYNHWLNVTASQGLPVLPILIMMTVILIRQIIARLRTDGSENDRLAAGAGLALLIIGIHDLVDFNLEVGINAAIACALAGWIQPVPASSIPPPGFSALWKRPWLAGISVVCLSVSVVIGLSDGCVRLSQAKVARSNGPLLSERWRWSARAVRILPWYAKARFRKAELLTEIALSGKSSLTNPALWSAAVDAWESYLASNPRDLEAHYLLAVSRIGLNGGKTSPAALEEMDRIIRDRDGQKPQLVTSVRYALDHSEPSDLLTVAWAERHIAEAIRRHPDPVSQWRLPNVLYAFWRRHFSQAESVGRMRSFYSGYDLGADALLFFLRTSNLWPYAAGFELEREGLKISPSASSDVLQELRRVCQEVKLSSDGAEWRADVGEAPSRAFHLDSRALPRASGAGHLLIRARGSACGGAASYLRIDRTGEEGGKVLGGILLSENDEQDYLVPVQIKDLTGRFRVRITFVNAENGPPNPCGRTGQVTSVSLIL